MELARSEDGVSLDLLLDRPGGVGHTELTFASLTPGSDYTLSSPTGDVGFGSDGRGTRRVTVRLAGRTRLRLSPTVRAR